MAPARPLLAPSLATILSLSCLRPFYLNLGYRWEDGHLECISCGYTWFSSRDAISSLTVDTPSSGGNVGTAPWATAKFDVLQKQLVSPRDQPDNKASADALQKNTVASIPKLERQKSFIKPKLEEPSAPTLEKQKAFTKLKPEEPSAPTLEKQKAFTKPKPEEPSAPSASH
ncbi:hypothetical protein TRIUR3_17023 [Triticum urartu]|uniref:Uncharacterized protein n=1 Tax=Triticum urartu TaxID=4572 RepID=M7ZTH3_TRIUA|nr:hypothetical protein TRIUR3_17023 [Triticum urartu]